jgi:transcriptional regulator with XRE-family HTH domain
MKLKEVRQVRELTQQKLSKKSGIHQTIISNIERGFRQPNAKIIKKLSQALDVEPSIFDWDPE